MQPLDTPISEPVITLAVLAGMVIAWAVFRAVLRVVRARREPLLFGGRPGGADLLHDVWETVADAPRLLSWRKGGRTGLGRAIVIAENTVREAVRKKVLWVVPVWFVTVVSLGVFVKPLDEQQDSYTLMSRLLLFSQLVVVVGTVSLLAVSDIGNERQRKTLFTLLVKPVTRLEVVFGKTLGHSMTALLLTVCMFAATHRYLEWMDAGIRAGAAARYEAARKANAEDPTRPQPDPNLKALARDGVLGVEHVRFPLGPVQIFNREGQSPLFSRSVRYMRTGGGQRAVATFANLSSANAYELPRLMVRFAGAPMPELLRRDHQSRIDANGRLLLPVKFSCVFSPGGDLRRSVSVAYPLMASDDISESLSEQEQKRLLAIRQNKVEIQVDNRNREFELRADFPVPESMLDKGPVEVAVACDTFGMYAGVHPTQSLFMVGVSATTAGVNPDRSLQPLGPIGIQGNRLRNRLSIMGISPQDDPFENVPGPRNLYAPDRAVWKFPGILPTDLEEGRPAELRMRMIVDVAESAFTESVVRVSLVTEDGRVRHEEEAIIDEGRPLSLTIPESFLIGKPFTATVTSRVTGHSLGLDVLSVRIATSREPFLAALAKAESMVWLQATLLAAIGLCAGTFLTWSVALLVVFFVLIIGSYKAYLLPLGQGHELFRSLGIAESFEMKSLSLYQEVMRGLMFLLGHLIGLCGYLAPNLRDFTEFEALSRGVAIAWPVLLADWLAIAQYALPFLILGYVVMRWKEAGE